MMHPIRIIDTGVRPARWNVAMTAALAELHEEAEIPDTLRFHRYPRCVLLGRSQDAGRAANLVYCCNEGIDIARRVTGGGAVFMYPQVLAWDVVVDRAAWAANLEAITRHIGQGVAAGLSRLGVVARFRAPNDIEIGGRKVSGSSGYVGRRSAVLQGTVLLTDEITVMACALRLPESSLRSNITCLAEACGFVPLLSEVTCALICGLTETLDREAVAQPLSAREAVCCEALLQEEIGADAFVFGTHDTGAAA